MKRLLLVVALLLGLAHAQTRITFYYPVGVAGPLARVIEGYVQEFEAEHPDINVEPVFGGNYQENQAAVVAAIRAGTPPDTAVLLSTQLFTLLELNAIDTFDELIAADPEGQELIDGFFSAFMLNSTFDGSVWSIPFQRSTPVMYFNKGAFREAGLDPENPPQTWEELVEVGQALTRRGDGGRVEQWGVSIPNETFGAWLFEGLVIQAGGILHNPDDGCTVNANDPATKRALQFLVELSQEHEVSPQGIIRWGTTPNDFVAGNSAIVYHSTGSLGFIRNNADFEFGTAFQPQGERYGVPTGGANFYIFRDQDPARRDATWTFIKWMTSPEMAARWSIDSGYVATREASWELPIMQEYTAQFPQALTARDQLQYAQPEFSAYSLQEVYDVLNQAIGQAVLGSATVDQALETAQAEIDAILAPVCNR